MKFTPYNLFNANHCALDAQWAKNICGLIATGSRRNDLRFVKPSMYQAHGKPAF